LAIPSLHFAEAIEGRDEEVHLLEGRHRDYNVANNDRREAMHERHDVGEFGFLEKLKKRHMFRVTAAYLGRRDEANRLLERALALRHDDYRTLYTAACTASLGGEHERALDFLDRAVATGRGYREWILNDNDLASLHDHPRFRQILSRLE
jgi:hypothetical protein